jgi:hypothetical protein
VQGYVFAAKTEAAKLAHRMGEYDLETKLSNEAQVLRKKFDSAFWCEDIGTLPWRLTAARHPAAFEPRTLVMRFSPG